MDEVLNIMSFFYLTILPPYCYAGHVVCVDRLIHAGSKVDTSCDGNPPLCMAVCLALLPGRSGVAKDIAHCLISAGADVLTE
jgi:hypothetical protein